MADGEQGPSLVLRDAQLEYVFARLAPQHSLNAHHPGTAGNTGEHGTIPPHWRACRLRLKRPSAMGILRWQTLPLEQAVATMNISLPEPLKQFVDEEVREGGFSGTSDYVRDLIRQRQREKAAEFLRKLIAEGLASGPATPQEPDFFDKMRERARARAGGE